MKKKIYKKKFLNKLIILTYLLLIPIASFAEVGDKKWSKECTDDKKECIIAINNQMAIPDSDKKQTLATAYIKLISTTERKMNLVEGEEKTYKLKEEKKLIPSLTVNLPLNVNLKKQVLIQVDKKNILNLPFSHCNAQVGCVVSSGVSGGFIKLLKAGKQLTIVTSVFNQKKNMAIPLSLKGFSKSYESLLE